MAHNIHYNEQSGQHSFFSVKEKPWHGLGKIVSDYPNSAEALRFAGLDYEVVKQDLYTTTLHENGQAMDQQQRIKTHNATMRTDTGEVLGVVGKDYEIIQNRDAFSFFDAIVGGEGIQYETAGALGKGERIFITAKLPSYIKVGKDDLIEQYLFLTTSHDAYGSITAAFTPTRIVCNNTLNAALRNQSNSIKIRHTANAKDRLEQAHKVMGISNQLGAQLEDLFNRWSKIKVSDPELLRLIRLALAPNKEVLNNISHGEWEELSTNFNNTCQSVFEYAMTAESQQLDTAKGSLFGAYNAVTGYFQNVRHYKTDEVKLKSLLFGGAAQLKGQRAFNCCLEFMNN
jgi:phage/plasmid-like protein (TIGR03299 family)